MDSFYLDGMPAIVFGAGIFSDIGFLIKESGAGNKALIVAGSNYLQKSGKLYKLDDSLAACGISCEIYSKVSPNPRAEEVDEAAQIIKDSGCDFVIGFGGGSAMDAAKAAAAVAVSGGRIWDYIRGENDCEAESIKGALPIVTIPTRYGSGAEVSIFSVISNDAVKEKAVLTTKKIMPSFAAIDPEFCMDLSTEQAGYAITDIAAHLIETYITGADRSPVADSLSETLLCDLIKNAYKVIDGNATIAEHKNISYISLLALTGITHAGRGGDFPLHDIEHPLSAHLDLAHGLGLGALLPHLMRFSFENAIERYEKLYLCVFKRLVNENFTMINCFKEVTAARGRAANAVDCLTEFFTRLGTFKKLGQYGLTNDMTERLASDVIRLYGCGLSYIANPKKLSHSDIAQLYRETL